MTTAQLELLYPPPAGAAGLSAPSLVLVCVTPTRRATASVMSTSLGVCVTLSWPGVPGNGIARAQGLPVFSFS